MMNLHLNPTLFNVAVVETSKILNIPEVFIEKDYWVCYALEVLFNSEYKESIVFKGGTSLSKCYNIINRFSEDIDISFIDMGLNGNQKKKALKGLSTILSQYLPELENDLLSNKKGTIRKTVHQYSQNSSDSNEVNNSKIVLESSHLGSPEPYKPMLVRTYISEMMKQANQTGLIDEYNLQAFNVNTQLIEKTMCEKVMSLVRFSYTENPYKELSKKIRHIYDLKMMFDDENLKNFFNSDKFNQMLDRVRREDKVTYSNAYDKPISEALIFSNPAETWKHIKNAYKPFTDMVINNIPSEDEMLNTIKLISDKLKSIDD